MLKKSKMPASVKLTWQKNNMAELMKVISEGFKVGMVLGEVWGGEALGEVITGVDHGAAGGTEEIDGGKKSDFVRCCLIFDFCTNGL
jgi:hypothetical protein